MSEDATKDLPVDSKLGELLVLVRSMDARLTAMDARSTSLEEKVDSRLKETRPIWEGVLARLETLSTEVSGFREETAKNFELVDSKFNIINDHILNAQAKQRLTEKRVEGLERKAS